MAKNPTPPREPTDYRTEAEREAAYAAANPPPADADQLAAAIGAVGAPMGKSEEAMKADGEAKIKEALEEQQKALDEENVRIRSQNQAIEQAKQGRAGGLAGLQAAAAEGHEVAGQIAFEVNTERAGKVVIQAIKRMSNAQLGNLVADIEDAKGDLTLEQFSVLDWLKAEFPEPSAVVAERVVPTLT